MEDWLWLMRTSKEVGHYEFHTQGPNENPWLDAGIDIRPEGTQFHCDAIAFEKGFPDADSALSEVLRVIEEDSALEFSTGSIEPVLGPGGIKDLSSYSSTAHIVRIQGVFDRTNTTVTASIENEGYIYFGVNLVVPTTE